MANEQFTPGDVVYLKSGGPAMTVTLIKGDAIWCIWFTDRTASEAHERAFPPTVLKKSENQ